MFEYFTILSQFKHTNAHTHIRTRMHDAHYLQCKIHRHRSFSCTLCVWSIRGNIDRYTKFHETSLLSGRSIPHVILEWRCLYAQTRLSLSLSLRASYLQFNIYISIGAYAYTGSSARSSEYGIFFMSNALCPCIYMYICKNRSTKIGNSTSRGIEIYRNRKTGRWRDALSVYKQKWYAIRVRPGWILKKESGQLSKYRRSHYSLRIFNI